METGTSQHVQTSVVAKLGKIVYGQLGPGADVYRGIMELAAAEGIETGLILNITGGLTHTRLSGPTAAGDVFAPPGFVELEGLAEATGTGYIGRTEDTWTSEVSQIAHHEGEPFLHCHMVVNVAGETHCGHLIEGCKVRSLHPKSHFVVVLAEAHGVDLSFHRGEPEGNYPNGLPYYELVARDG
jgi:hypothetical protein